MLDAAGSLSVKSQSRGGGGLRPLAKSEMMRAGAVPRQASKTQR